MHGSSLTIEQTQWGSRQLSLHNQHRLYIAQFPERWTLNGLIVFGFESRTEPTKHSTLTYSKLLYLVPRSTGPNKIIEKLEKYANSLRYDAASTRETSQKPTLTPIQFMKINWFIQWKRSGPTTARHELFQSILHGS